ncbi:MAG: RimK/LysX family protein [bacterium]|nr:RimK/LysX family protein [bacterium]
MEHTSIINRIGSVELLHFPDASIYNVPAKIDTGADSCAVWASDIIEIEGVLSFCLFSAGSVFYTGDRISTTEYKTTPVKNSFGEKEIRYVVKLKVAIGDRQIKARFSLADRSRNHFPILLGKNFLKKRFLVDVSASYVLSPVDEFTKHNNLTILTSRNDEKSEKFFSLVKENAVDIEINLTHYNDLAFWFDEHPKVTTVSTGKDLADSKIIYFKNYKKYLEQAIAIALYARYRNVIFRDEEIGQSVSTSKLSEMMLLNTYGLPIPRGVAMATDTMTKHVDEVISYVGLPLVLKDVFSDRGKNNYYIETKSDLLTKLKNASKECYFVAQKYIPNKGFSRVLVLGNDAVMMVERSQVKHAEPEKIHLNKPKGGSNATLVEAGKIPSKLTSIAIKSSKVLQRQIAGIDLIQDNSNKKWYILEVNYNPDMVGSSFESKKAAAFGRYISKEMERW